MVLQVEASQAYYTVCESDFSLLDLATGIGGEKEASRRRRSTITLNSCPSQQRMHHARLCERFGIAWLA